MKQRVLFLCTGNSARSQMAEGLLRHLAGDRYDVSSAGTHPVGLNPGAVTAMQELGIDISAQRSKRMDEFVDQAFDYVITVCDRAKESCPRWPHTERPKILPLCRHQLKNGARPFGRCGIKSRHASKNSSWSDFKDGTSSIIQPCSSDEALPRGRACALRGTPL